MVSRKLVGALAAIISISGIVIGLASIVPTTVTTELAGMAITLVAGLGGYQVARQARIDEADKGITVQVVEDGRLKAIDDN